MALLGRPLMGTRTASAASPRQRSAAVRAGGVVLAVLFANDFSGLAQVSRADEPPNPEHPASTPVFLVADAATPGTDADSPESGPSSTGAIRDLLIKNLGTKRPVSNEGSAKGEGTAKGTTNPEADEPQVAFETARGTSSATVKKQATTEVPIAELSIADRARAQSILDDTSYFRRLPTLTVPVVPDVYLHFLGHPDTAASVWRAMNISKLKLRSVSPTAYEGDTGDGTTGRMELVHRKLGGDGVEQLVVLCEGSYKSPLLPKPIQARSMLVLRTKFTRETDGQVYATHRGDVFVSFPSQTIEAVSKLMTPVTAMLSDRTFCEVTVFLKLMSAAMCRRPDWVEHVVAKMEGVPEERKHELLVLTAQTFVARNREALSKGVTRVQPVEGGEAAATPADPVKAASVKTSPNKSSGDVGGPTIRPAVAEQPARERSVDKGSESPKGAESPIRR